MMQQVATSGSEIAALKGKTGKGAEGDAEKGSAFDALFQQARSADEKRTTSDPSSASSSQSAPSPKDKAGNVEDGKAALRDKAAATDTPTDVVNKQNKGKASETRSDAKSEQSAEDAPIKASEPVTNDGVKTTIPVDPETDIPDDGNLVNLDAKQVKMTWDEWLAAQEGDVDWLAYIDAVRQANGDVEEGVGKKGKTGDDGEILPVIPSPVSDSGDVADGSDTQSDHDARVNIPEIPVEEALQPNIAVLKEAWVKSVNESGEAKPGDGKQEILPIMPIVEKLTALLTKQNQLDAEGKPNEAELSEQITALAAQLSEALKSAQQDSSTKEAGEGSMEFDIEGLIASFKGETANDAGSGEQPSDAQLLIDLMQTEMVAVAKDGSEKAVITPVTPQIPVNAAGNTDIAGEEVTAMRRLMNEMAQVSEESQSKVTQSLADKVVSLLPVSATEQQQNTVKQAVIAGVQEIQSQLSQGHEPGIDLKALIVDAAKEANIPVTNQMMAQAEQQASQLQQMLSTAQSAAHQTATAQVASADTMIQENTQVRSEATKAQHQADSMDKPVNITKAEGLQQLNEKIRWMLNARNSMAEIRLDPPELGSMQVRVNVSGDTASVNFVVQSQQARDALADATPRLRDMLAEQGIELGESFVQQQSSDEGNAGNDGESQFAGNGAQQGEEEDMQIIEQPVTRESMGGIDYYA